MASIRISDWSAVKDFIDNRNDSSLHFVELNSSYEIVAMDGLFQLEITLVKGRDDANDFEANYQSRANRRERLLTATDAKKSPFGHQINVEKHTFINIKYTHGVSDLRDSQTVTGSAAITEDTGKVILSTGTTEGSRAVLETKERLNYIPGFAIESGLGVRVPVQPTSDQDIKWGYFDDNNGWGFGMDSTDYYVFVRKGGVDQKTYKSNWNIDKLDGNGRSGASIEVNKGYTFETSGTWYGFGGTVLYTVFLTTENEPKHPINFHEEDKDDLIVNDPNLPLKMEVDNGTTASDITAEISAKQASLIGIGEREERNSSDDVGPITLTNNNKTPIMSIRKKPTFKGKANTVKCSIKNLQAAVSDGVLIEIWKDTSLTGASWNVPSGVSSDETAIEIDKSATDFSGGNPRLKKIASASEKGSNKKGRLDERDIDGLVIYDNEILTITAQRRFNRDTDVEVLVDVGEEW